MKSCTSFIFAVWILISGISFGQASKAFATPCDGQLSELDYQLRNEFAQNFDKILRDNLLSGNIEKNDLLTGNLVKASSKVSSKMTYYVLKGEKSLYIFTEQKKMFKRFARSYLKLEPYAGNFAIPRFRLPGTSLSDEPLIDVGPLGILKYVSMDNDNRAPWGYELAPASESPEEILKQFRGVGRQHEEEE